MPRSQAPRRAVPSMQAMGLAVAVGAASLATLATPARALELGGGITLSVQGEAGITLSPTTSSRGLNFGHLFTDRPEEPVLNQVLVTLAKPLDPKIEGYQIGFKLQGMYGTDARYTHFAGEFDHTLRGRYQLDLVEANVQIHTPWLTPGGIDWKIGQYATPMGFETIDPSTNPFYTHSYIFNFGLPLKHTGVLSVTHATPNVDVYLGLDTGVNTSIGKGGDNNSALAALFGAQLTLLDGKLTVLALSHIGSETPTSVVPNANHYMRYFNDIAITYKPNDKLTLVTELNFVRDDFAKANAYGIAQYAGLALNDMLTLNARAEVFRDERGFFVGAFPGSQDFANALVGRPATVLSAGPATYGALTLGATIKPKLPGPITGLLIRPEVRYDTALNDARPYNGGRDRSAFLFATDVVLGF
jgi:hypothetical protein